MGDLINYSGVYRITCSPTGKTYIGSAKRFRARWSLHKVQLRQGKHHSPHLQNAWDKHGQDAFVFEILLVCAPEMAVFYEQVFIDAITTAKSRIKNGMSVMEAITRPVAETGIRCRNTGVA